MNKDLYLTASEIIAKAPKVKKGWIYRYCCPSEEHIRDGHNNLYSIDRILKTIEKRIDELSRNHLLARKKRSDGLRTLENMKTDVIKILLAHEKALNAQKHSGKRTDLLQGALPLASKQNRPDIETAPIGRLAISERYYA